jgi:hypothetical protein
VPGLAAQVERYSVVIAIGGVAVRVNTADADFLALLEARYAGFVVAETSPDASAEFEFDVDLVAPAVANPDVDVSVIYRSGRWLMERGDFRAEWEPATGRGWIRQSANPYSIDAVLRIVHTLVMAKQGGFLLHSASAVRNGKAFLFAGVSGAGKTTISRLAPADATLLTDEISYVRKLDVRKLDSSELEGSGEIFSQKSGGYVAYGTPFTGELAKLGENTSAPVAALYLLAKGAENRIDRVTEADAGRELLANMLFFAGDQAEDRELVYSAFQAACDFVHCVPVYRLTFVPDARVWEMIG